MPGPENIKPALRVAVGDGQGKHSSLEVIQNCGTCPPEARAAGRPGQHHVDMVGSLLSPWLRCNNVRQFTIHHCHGNQPLLRLLIQQAAGMGGIKFESGGWCPEEA